MDLDNDLDEELECLESGNDCDGSGIRAPRMTTSGEVCVRCGLDHPKYGPGSEGCGDRPCGKCGAFVFDGCPDPCLGHLPGVRAACCGHDFGVPYLLFTNGVSVSFESGALFVRSSQAKGRAS